MTGRLHAGLCLFGLGGLDLDAACRIAVLSGVQHVSLDFAMIRGREELDVLLDDPAASGRQLAFLLDTYGLQPVELFQCAVPVAGGVFAGRAGSRAAPPGGRTLPSCRLLYGGSRLFPRHGGARPRRSGLRRLGSFGTDAGVVYGHRPERGHRLHGGTASGGP